MGRKYLVNLLDETSFVEYQEQLFNQWHFSNDNIAAVLENYKHYGEIKQYQEEHYLILHDLIELHLKPLEEKEKSAFLAYNRARLMSIHNTKPLSALLSFMAAAVITPMCSVIPEWSTVGAKEVGSALVLLLVWSFWVAMNFLSIKQSGSPANNFYESLFAAFLER